LPVKSRDAAPDPLAFLASATEHVQESPAEALRRPVVDRHGQEMSLRWTEPPVEMHMHGLREASDGVHAELAVHHEGHEIHWGNLNLASTSGREGVVKKLEAVTRTVPWRPMLERACRLTAAAVREQAPSLLLRARRAEGPRYLIEPILPLGETAVLFGDGGAGKGFAALALGLAAASGAVLPGGLTATRRILGLYLDWESTVEEIEERLHLLTRGLGCTAAGLYYRRMTRALADDVAALQAEVSRLGVGLVIVDSLAPACGAEPEGADAAIRCMNALRALGPVTRLVQAHVSKAGANQRTGAARPFGSVFVQNLARSVWELRRSEDSAGDDLTVGLYHRKTNRGRLHAPLSLRFHFDAEAVTLHAADLRDSGDLLARTSATFQIKKALATGARTVAELVEETEKSRDTVLRLLRRLKSQQIAVDLGDGRWGLKA
jgi:AAA domain-containing protein